MSVISSGTTAAGKPAPYLQHGEVGLAWQAEFLLLWWVGLEAVLVQPASQNLNRLGGQVAAAPTLALPKQPFPWQVERGAVIAVWHRRGVLLLRAMLFFQSWGRGGESWVTFTATALSVSSTPTRLNQTCWCCVFVLCRVRSAFLPLQQWALTSSSSNTFLQQESC